MSEGVYVGVGGGGDSRYMATVSDVGVSPIFGNISLFLTVYG